MQELRLMYITCSNKKEARAIGKSLVSERLAACVNIINHMESMYWWNDTVETDKETILIAKTIADKTVALTDRVKELHSYDCPCVMAIKPQTKEGNGEYLAWLKNETATK